MKFRVPIIRLASLFVVLIVRRDCPSGGPSAVERAMSVTAAARRSRGVIRAPSIGLIDVNEAIVSASGKVLRASSILDGTGLQRLATENGDTFERLVSSQRKLWPPSQEMTWAHICSGTNGPAFAMEAIQNDLRERGFVGGPT